MGTHFEDKNTGDLPESPASRRPQGGNRKKASLIWASVLGTLACALAAALLTGLRLELNGGDTTLALGESYREKGASAGFFGMDLSQHIRVEGAVDDQVPGSYRLTYSLGGSPWPRPASRVVTVRDIAIPQLLLVGGGELTLALDSTFQEPGYQATDNWDGDLTEQVTVSGQVDTGRAGSYELTYQVTDSSGNTAQAVRTVQVLDSSPLTMSLAEFTLDEYFPGVILPQAQTPAGQEYLEETVFIGDSITENGLGFGFFPYRSVWAKPALQPDTILDTPIKIYGGGDDGHDTEMTAVEAAAKHQPKRVIINVGSNCAFWMKPEEYAQYYGEFIAQLRQASPQTLIVVSSVYPVDRRYDDSPRTMYTTNNDKINKINFALAEMCRQNQVKFLNVAQALKDENGQARPGALYQSDGIHPYRQTYPAILDYILSHPYYGEDEEAPLDPAPDQTM